MDFDWDDGKAESNLCKHGVSFLEAATVFNDPLALVGYDPDPFEDEDRLVTMGLSAENQLLIVCHTDRDGTTRIISAREADRRERKDYEDGNFP